MLRKLRTRFRSEEQGFTLIELLVVILIIGILAAIALPVFLGQQKKGQDADSKSAARNLVSQVESCFADNQDYTLCDTTGELGTTGLKYGTANGEVNVAAATATTFTVTGHSRSDNKFHIQKIAAGTLQRSCSAQGTGACRTPTATDPLPSGVPAAANGVW